MGFEALADWAAFSSRAIALESRLGYLFRTFFLLSVTLLAKPKPPSRFLPRLATRRAAVLGAPVVLGLLSLASTTTTL